MEEKNIDAEIKKKHEEFDRDIEAYRNQFKMRGLMGTGLSPAIQSLREKAMGLRNRFAPTRR